MQFRTFVTLFLFGSFSCNGFAQSDVGIAEVPDWVDQLSIVEFSEDRSAEFQLGVAYLIGDRQIRKTDDGFEFFERSAYRIIDRSGLEGSATIARSFDPESETLSFNQVRILRDGEEIDRLTDAEITVLRQEQGLGSNILDGNLTALIQLEDVRVGDVIDYSISGYVTSELWPDEVFDLASIEWSVPLAQLHYRLMVPETLDVNVQGLATDIEPEVSLDDGWRSFRIHVLDADPIPFEFNVAPDWVTYGFVVFSSMDSWADVVDWAMPLFSFEEPLPIEFASRLDAIAMAYDDPRDRAVHTLRLVQEDIRYLGLEVGLGSHVPRSPAVTLQLGYGDCKDKAVLLVSSLEYLGIDAVPVLASLFSGDLLPQFPATIGAFDHVIVEIDFGNEKLYVDPTLSHQGGSSDRLAPLDYGHVLPIRRGQSELTALIEPLPEAPVFEIIESFEFGEAGESGLIVTVEQIYRSGLADAMRFEVSSFGQESLGRGMLDYYSANYDVTSEIRPFAITDDFDANEIVFESQYEVDADAFDQNDYSNTLPVFATAVQEILPRQVEAQRTAPLGLPYGINARHVIRILTPGRRFMLPPEASESAGGVSYTRRFRQEGNAFELEYTLVVSEKVAELDSIRPVIAIADEIALNSELSINMQAARARLSQRMGLSMQLDEEAETALASVGLLIAQEDFVSALTEINTLLERYVEADEFRGALQLMKATSLVFLGRDAAARAPFAEAFALHEPMSLEAYMMYTRVLSRAGEPAEATQHIIRMLEQRQELVDGADLAWVIDFLQYLFRSDLESEAESLVLALAQTFLEIDQDGLEQYNWIFTEAVENLVARQQSSAAIRFLALMNNPRDFARLQSNREYEAIWDAIADRAGEDLAKIIEEYVSTTKNALDDAPSDFRRRTAHLSALRMVGRMDEALEFAEPIAEDWARIEAVGNDAYWFVNEYAYALADAGFEEDAHALMSRLVNIGVAENDDLISMAINRAVLLMHWEEYEAALNAVSELESLGDGYASDFGWMWVYHVKACSLYRSDRIVDAEVVLRDSVIPIAESNPIAHTVTMLCLDQPDQVAEIIVDRLGRESTRDGAISGFAETVISSTVPPLVAELQARAAQIRARPEVQSALNDVGRAISINGSKAYWGDFY